jgi:hypothetical protein
MAKITVKDTEVVFYKKEQEDYISLTDMARYKDSMEPSLVISHWMSTRYTVDFMGIWESVNNLDFKPTEFGRFKMESGSNELICLSNMENINAVFINEGVSQSERLIKLNQIAIQQMSVLQDVENRKLLK